jgi:hypothetical protein
MSTDLDMPTLTALVQLHLPDISVARLLPIATGKHNRSYWVEAVDGQRWVLRVAPPDTTGLLFYERQMMRQEPRLHELVRARTDIPAPKIVAADFSRSWIDRDWLLMSGVCRDKPEHEQ